MSLARFTQLVMTGLVLAAVASSGKTQELYQGKFTLPFETHWGNATLPAGDYTFNLLFGNSPYTF